MAHSVSYTIACIGLSIVVIVVFTTVLKLPAFFALLLACLLLGVGLHLSPVAALAAVQQGFGDILKSLGLIVILGTTLGAVLQHTGSTKRMSDYLLQKTGTGGAAFAVNCTGFLVGMPMFCGAGYLVLHGLNNSIAKQTGTSMVLLTASLATSLLSVHCLLPPHPGVAAAAGIIGANLGPVILLGIPVAFCSMLAAFAWSVYASKRFSVIRGEDSGSEPSFADSPSALMAFLPVLTPVVLIAAGSFFVNSSASPGIMHNVFVLISNPLVALSTGIGLALLTKKRWTKKDFSNVLNEGIEQAGGTLIIIGAGGAFGAVMAAAKLDAAAGDGPAVPGSLGLLFPFLLSAFLKTAQGSSTVAVITAASVVHPLLPGLGLSSDAGKILCVLSLGAGSMAISHANDAFFWLVAKLSGLETKPMLTVFSMATAIMGVVAFALIYLISLFY